MSNLYDRVLITGGGGMLAHALAAALQRRGINPIVFNRKLLDVSKSNELANVFTSQNPTIVLNCAAYTKVDLAEVEPDDATSANVTAPSLLAQFAKRFNTKLVHFSTDFVFGGNATEPYAVTAPTEAKSVYGATKDLGDKLIASSGVVFLIVRTSWLYGTNGPNFVQTMLTAARAGKPLTVVDNQIGSPTFTHDLADVTLELIDRGSTGIYHATNSGQTSWFEFAKAIFEEFDIPNVDLKPISSAKWKELRPASAVRPAYSVLDCSATEQLIGRPMPHWREALHRYRLAIESSS